MRPGSTTKGLRSDATRKGYTMLLMTPHPVLTLSGRRTFSGWQRGPREEAYLGCPVASTLVKVDHANSKKLKRPSSTRYDLASEHEQPDTRRDVRTIIWNSPVQATWRCSGDSATGANELSRTKCRTGFHS